MEIILELEKEKENRHLLTQIEKEENERLYSEKKEDCKKILKLETDLREKEHVLDGLEKTINQLYQEIEHHEIVNLSIFKSKQIKI